MARLKIYKDNDVDSTVVSNLFIDEYMRDANDAQLKIYLYLLRMMNARQATSVSDIADKFNHTEKDVVRALKYWARQKLLDLDFDEDKNLVGIHIHDLCADTPADSRSSLSASFIPMPTALPASQATAGEYVSAPEVFAAPEIFAAPDTFNESAPEKKKPFPSHENYTADQLRAFKEQEETSELLFIAESYLKRPLTVTEMKKILYFMDGLHFSKDLVDYLIQYCIDRGAKSFNYIEKVAANWAAKGISTPEQAQLETAFYEKNVYIVMKNLGKSGVPTPTEVNYITRWVKEYKFSDEVILEACRRTVLATDRHRFQYADKLLGVWKEQDVHQTSDIRKLDEIHQQRRLPLSPEPVPRKSVNRFNQFEQNSYDFDALEQKLLSN